MRCLRSAFACTDDGQTGEDLDQMEPIAANFIDSVKVAVKVQLKRYKMKKVGRPGLIVILFLNYMCSQATYVSLYKQILKKMHRMHKGRKAPIIRKSPEHLRLEGLVDELFRDTE